MAEVAGNQMIAGTSAPGADEIARLASQGFKAIVDLRTGREPDQPISPEREKEEAQKRGLHYLHLPVETANLDPTLVDRFRHQVSQLPGPIFVHCSSGRRAQAVVSAALEADSKNR